MSRSILLVCLLVGVALSAPVFSVSSIEQRISALDVTDTCTKNPSFTCLGAGATCVSESQCDKCTNKFNECVANLTSADGLCDCFTAYVNCAAALKNNIACPSLILFDTCNSTVTNCSCGTPYPKNEGSFCRTGYSCSNSTNTCVKLGGLGSTCSENGDCYTENNRAIECRDDVCHYKKYSGYAGDACSEDEDCGGYAYDESTCVSGKCTGVAIGGNCTVTAACVSGSFCNSTTNNCQKLKAEGEFCGDDDACAIPFLCNNEACTKIASVPSGGKCESSVNCNFGLMCKDGICGSQVYSKNCSSNSQCSVANGYDGTCDCDYTLGYEQCTPADYAVPSSCQGSVDNLVSCFQTSGCNPNGDCDACSKAANCYYNCVQKEYFSGNPALSSDCTGITCDSPSATTGSDGSSAGIISASVAVVIAAIVLVIA